MPVNVKFNNRLESTIADVAGIASDGLVFNLATGDGDDVPDISGDGYIYAYFVDDDANWELVKISSIDGDQCTISSTSHRGLGGSSAAAWDQDDKVLFAPCAEELEDIIEVVNDNEDDIATNLASIAAILAGTATFTKTAISAYRGTQNQSITAVTETLIVYNATDTDTLGELSSGIFTATKTGRYRISAGARFISGISAGTELTMTIAKSTGGVETEIAKAKKTANGTVENFSISRTFPLTAGDTVGVYAYSTDACYLAENSGSSYYTYLDIDMI